MLPPSRIWSEGGGSEYFNDIITLNEYKSAPLSHLK
jgi:hypothetical protein